MDIEIKKLTIQKDNKSIFNDFSITFPEKMISGISAPSGWGKTTLLSWIEDNYKEVSCAYQDLRILENETVFNNLLIPLSVKFEKKQATIFADTILKAVELEKYSHRKITGLSGGEKQRVSLARALVFPSKILLLDEPFQNLDEKLKIKIMDYIKNLQKTEPRTILFVTHEKKEAEYLCDRIFSF